MKKSVLQKRLCGRRFCGRDNPHSYRGRACLPGARGSRDPRGGKNNSRCCRNPAGRIFQAGGNDRKMIRMDPAGMALKDRASADRALAGRASVDGERAEWALDPDYAYESGPAAIQSPRRTLWRTVNACRIHKAPERAL